MGDFENFVADIIHGFASKDPDIRHQAVLKANKLMKEEQSEISITSSKNKSAKSSVKPEHAAADDDDVDDVESRDIINQHNNVGHGDEIRVLNIVDFLEDLSMDDIDTRKLTRPERKQKADEFRKQGNLSFAQKQYTAAVEYYTRAIDLIRDSACLYTNRSFAYIRLGAYDLAVKDCDKAIFIAEYSLRARLYKAHALFSLGEVAHCLACLQETRQILPFHQSTIDHCEKNLFGALQPQDKAKNDTFSTEKFMRLAAQFDVEQMESFFLTNGYI